MSNMFQTTWQNGRLFTLSKNVAGKGTEVLCHSGEKHCRCKQGTSTTISITNKMAGYVKRQGRRSDRIVLMHLALLASSWMHCKILLPDSQAELAQINERHSLFFFFLRSNQVMVVAHVRLRSSIFAVVLFFGMQGE